MSLILVGSQTSPYVRKLRIFLKKENIPFELKEINFFEKEGSDYLNKVTPINKIPVLVDGEKTIWDSRVIFNYIQKKINSPPLTIDEENLLSAIDSIIDSNIILLLSKRSKLDIDGDYMIFKRNIFRTKEVLNFLKPTLIKYTLSGKWDFISISLYCCLDWLLFRELVDLSSWIEAVEFLNRFKNSDLAQETQPPLALK